MSETFPTLVSISPWHTESSPSVHCFPSSTYQVREGDKVSNSRTWSLEGVELGRGDRIDTLLDGEKPATCLQVAGSSLSRLIASARQRSCRWPRQGTYGTIAACAMDWTFSWLKSPHRLPVTSPAPSVFVASSTSTPATNPVAPGLTSANILADECLASAGSQRHSRSGDVCRDGTIRSIERTKTRCDLRPQGAGQWALRHLEPLNPNERTKKDDDGLNVRSPDREHLLPWRFQEHRPR